MLLTYFILFTFALFYYIKVKSKPDAQIQHLSRGNGFFTSLFNFIKYPSLKAMRLNYWPYLFNSKSPMLSWYLGKWWVVISDSTDISNIFKNYNQVEKLLFSEISKDLLVVDYMGENVLYSHTESWKRHRRIINSCFHKEINVNKYEKSVKRLMIHLKKSRNKSIDVHDLISKTTLDILGNTIMGFDLNCLDIEEGEYSKAYNLAAAGVSKDIYFFFPILEKLNLESRIREREAVHKFRGLVQYLIKFKKLQMSNNPNKQEEEDKVDMLSLMIEATMQEEVHKRLTDDELINNIVVMFAAGHDTTANTLSFTLYHLAKNQHIQDKARKEILEHFNGDSKYPTMDMVKEMNYVEAIIYESMRVTPTLPQIRRKLINDYSCNDGTYLPKGTNIILQSYSIMNDPNIWEEPSTFLPDRFLQNNQINKAKMNNWYGFGGGSRICIGQNLSIIEQKILMMCILSKFKITLPSNSIHSDDIITSKGVVLRPINLHLNFQEL